MFSNTFPSYLKNNFVNIYEHHKHTTRSSRFNYVMLKINYLAFQSFDVDRT